MMTVFFDHPNYIDNLELNKIYTSFKRELYVPKRIFFEFNFEGTVDSKKFR